MCSTLISDNFITLFSTLCKSVRLTAFAGILWLSVNVFVGAYPLDFTSTCVWHTKENIDVWAHMHFKHSLFFVRFTFDNAHNTLFRTLSNKHNPENHLHLWKNTGYLKIRSVHFFSFYSTWAKFASKASVLCFSIIHKIQDFNIPHPPLPLPSRMGDYK
jgi:hypothetical protein